MPCEPPEGFPIGSITLQSTRGGSLRMERDATFWTVPVSLTVFQSTRSVWSATTVSAAKAVKDQFQSTRSVWSATRQIVIASDYLLIVSIHALRMERYMVVSDTLCWKMLFQSTRSVWSATASGYGYLRL